MMQAYLHLAGMIEGMGGTARRPPMGAATRWAGFLPMVEWVNEFKAGILSYNVSPAQNTVANDDGSEYKEHLMEDYEWVEVAQMDGVLRPVGPFISTLEATKKITISLVLPMVGLLMKALHPLSPVLVRDYSDIVKPVTVTVQGSDLVSVVDKLRSQLLFENKKRFMEGERVGHMEDLLVSTILDPRYPPSF